MRWVCAVVIAELLQLFLGNTKPVPWVVDWIVQQKDAMCALTYARLLLLIKFNTTHLITCLNGLPFPLLNTYI